MPDSPMGTYAIHMSWSQQSPIDIRKSLYAPGMPTLEFDYEHEMVGHFGEEDLNNFLVKPVLENEAAAIVYEGVRCPLIKMHFHKPSEHLVDGVTMSFEAHLVHKVPTFPESFPSALIVVAVFFDVDSDTPKGPCYASLEDAVVAQFKMTEQEKCYLFHPDVFLPNDRRRFYRYEGSLTSSPFTEAVSWIVMDEHNDLDTVIEFEIEEGSLEPARKVQPLNRRFILRNFECSTQKPEAGSKESTSEGRRKPRK